jgi:hypothetical protein
MKRVHIEFELSVVDDCDAESLTEDITYSAKGHLLQEEQMMSHSFTEEKSE